MTGLFDQLAAEQDAKDAPQMPTAIQKKYKLLIINIKITKNQCDQ